MKVQSRRWLNFQVVAWAAVLTSRNSHESVYYMLVIQMSFIPGLFYHKIMTLLLHAVNNIPVLIVTVKVCESHSAARLKVASCKSLSPSREVIGYGADPLCSRCTPMITHVFIAGFRTNIDTVSEQCASNGDLPHSADTCIFFVKNINICQPRQCRSNSNQDRTSPFHMSLSSECYVLVLAGN